MDIPHWINGSLYTGQPEGKIEVDDPASGQTRGYLLQASREDLDYAVGIAVKAQKAWARTSLAKRTEIMYRIRQLVLDHQDEIAKAIVAEHGKDYSDAIGEIQRGGRPLILLAGLMLP